MNKLFKTIRLGNRIQVKTYKDGDCTSIAIMKYNKAYKAMKQCQLNGWTVTGVLA